MTFFGGSNPIGQPTGYVASVNGETGDVTVITETDVQSDLAARTDLGAMAPAVQQIAKDEVSAYNVALQQQLAALTPPSRIGPVTVLGTVYATLEEAIPFMSTPAGGGPSSPVIATAPTVSDTTINGGQVVTVTQGTYNASGGGAYAGTISRVWQWILVAAPQGTWTLGVGNAAQAAPAAGPSAQVLILEELATTVYGTISNRSAVLTLNALAAPVPTNSITPQLTGSFVPSATLTVGDGTWNANGSAVLDYTRKIYGGDTPANGGLLLTTLATSLGATTFVLTAGVYDGLDIVLGVSARNANGSGTEAYSPKYRIGGGTVPTLNAPVGIVYTGSAPTVGGIVYLDYGLLSGSLISDFWDGNPNPTGFVVTLYLDAAPISGGGANVTQATLPAASDGKIFSYKVTASNGANISAVASSSGVQVAPAVAGGSLPVIVDSTTFGTNTAASVDVPMSSMANAAQGDWVEIVAALNTGTTKTISTPSGWTADASNPSSLTVVNGKRLYRFYKVLGASEPATVTLSFTGGSEICGGVAYAIRNVTSQIAAPAATLADASNANPITLSFATATATANNQAHLLISVLDAAGAESATYAPTDTAYSTIVQNELTGNGAEWMNIWAGFKVVASGATGAKTAVATLTPSNPAGTATLSRILG